ncbi:MAG: DUF1858 domain-containing protein [Aquificae bacterium]|nr:DUF1858 domain-containing protein [Aquificota bacterium]
MKITLDTKVFHLLEDYPQTEQIIKKYFNYFYKEKLENIALKRLSIKGAFCVLNLPEKDREIFLDEINQVIIKSK